MREKLVSLEIPFVQHTTSRGSSKRQLLVDKYGKFAVPYLEVGSLAQILASMAYCVFITMTYCVCEAAR